MKRSHQSADGRVATKAAARRASNRVQTGKEMNLSSTTQKRIDNDRPSHGRAMLFNRDSQNAQDRSNRAMSKIGENEPIDRTPRCNHRTNRHSQGAAMRLMQCSRSSGVTSNLNPLRLPSRIALVVGCEAIV